MQSKFSNKILIIILVVFLLSTIIILNYQNTTLTNLMKYRTPLKIGSDAQMFAKRSIINENVVTIKGKSSLLLFFSTTCQGCAKLFIILRKMETEGKFEGINLICISEDSEKDTKKYIAYQNISFPVIADPKKEIILKYHITFAPSLVFVNAQGKIQLYQKFEESPVDFLNKVISIL